MLHYTEAFISALHSHFLILWAKAGRSHIAECGAVCIQSNIPPHLSETARCSNVCLTEAGTLRLTSFPWRGNM